VIGTEVIYNVSFASAYLRASRNCPSPKWHP
jgi:hypothetical protein